MMSRVDKSPVATWWWTVDRWFLAAFLSLMGLGIVLSFAASPAVAERIGLDSFHFATRQIVFTLPALVAMLGVSFLEARQIRRMALVVLCVSLVLMVAALYVGVEVKGARRWVSLAGLSIQPSEFLKPAFVIICAWLFAEHARQPDIPGNLFAMILLGIVVALAGRPARSRPDHAGARHLGRHVLHGRHAVAVDHRARRGSASAAPSPPTPSFRTSPAASTAS